MQITRENLETVEGCFIFEEGGGMVRHLRSRQR